MKALLVLPHLRIQNANAISGPFTHGFPSITAITGLMWALQRNLSSAGIPLRLHRVGVICHRAEELVADGYVKTFRLTRNPVEKDGSTASIVEEGRMHLDITLLFDVGPSSDAASPGLHQPQQLADWAQQIGEMVARMRVAGGSVLPAHSLPGRRTQPWIAALPGDYDEQVRLFARWRRQWLPGHALVGRDDLLEARHRMLRETQPEATLLDAWLHAARFNHEPLDAAQQGSGKAGDDRVRWGDPMRSQGAGWTVPIPVGYAALAPLQEPGAVANTRDPSIPFAWVESVYSFGEWLSPHRLTHPHELMWAPETDTERGLYRCRSGYQGAAQTDFFDEALPSFD
ncbi:type I-F CRISPR-associated protein Csy2 [Burkholderia sp. 3C]